MRKTLLLLTIFGLTSAANATLSLSLNGNTDISEITVNPDDYITVGIFSDDALDWIAYLNILDDPDIAEIIDKDFTPFAGPDSSYNEYSYPPYREYEVVMTDLTGGNVTPGEVHFEVLLRCAGPGDVDIYLYDEYVTLVDTAVIHQTTGPNVPEDNLVAWWKLDGDASDSAGSNHGTAHGRTWTTGLIGGALDFNGTSDYILVPDSDSISVGASDHTMCAWIKPDDIAQSGSTSQVFSKVKDEDDKEYVFRIDDGGYLRKITEKNGSNESAVTTTIPVTIGPWQHIAVTFDADTKEVVFYHNGIPQPDTSTITTLPDQLNNDLIIGKGGGPYTGGHFEGLMDDLRIYNRALSAEEIDDIYRGEKAFLPNPSDGQTGVDPNVVLNWRPGKYADSHDVYLGLDSNDVNDANTSSSEFMGNFDVNSYDPCGIEIATWYYWRVDEINEAEPNIWKGDVWSFKTKTAMIELSDTQFDFTAEFNGDNPASQILSISNSGLGTLNWTVEESCSWLTVAPDSGSVTDGADDVNLIVDISGLGGGMHSCELTIADPNADNSPQTATVNLDVNGPEIQLSETQFLFTFIPGGPNPPDQTLTIRNSGIGTLNWAIDYDCNWLTVDPNSGSSTGDVNDDVILSIDTTGLGQDDIYTCQLTISDPNAENNPQLVNITLRAGCWQGDMGSWYKWVSVGKPECWCKSVNPRQCHGDTDGLASGKKSWWASTADLNILKAAWQINNGPTTEPGICADFDHLGSGKSNWRVSTYDLNILKKHWHKNNQPDPNCQDVEGSQEE